MKGGPHASGAAGGHPQNCDIPSRGLMRVSVMCAVAGLDRWSIRGTPDRMGESCLAEHLGRYVELSAEERDALTGLNAGRRQYRRGTVIRPEHGPSGDIYVVESGWVFCSAMLE